jgi:hypothetical protein
MNICEERRVYLGIQGYQHRAKVASACSQKRSKAVIRLAVPQLRWLVAGMWCECCVWLCFGPRLGGDCVDEVVLGQVFSYTTVSLANSHSIRCSILIVRGWCNRPISGRRATCTPSHLTSRNKIWLGSPLSSWSVVASAFGAYVFVRSREAMNTNIHVYPQGRHQIYQTPPKLKPDHAYRPNAGLTFYAWPTNIASRFPQPCLPTWPFPIRSITPTHTHTHNPIPPYSYISTYQ